MQFWFNSSFILLNSLLPFYFKLFYLKFRTIEALFQDKCSWFTKTETIFTAANSEIQFNYHRSSQFPHARATNFGFHSAQCTNMCGCDSSIKTNAKRDLFTGVRICQELLSTGASWNCMSRCSAPRSETKINSVLQTDWGESKKARKRMSAPGCVY